MELHVAQADLSALAVDAVVVPCTSMGRVCQIVRDHMSDTTRPALEAELKAKAPLAVGAAMIAAGGDLQAKNAILAPIVKEEGDEIATELLRRAIKASLVAANMKGYETIAVPSMVKEGGSPTVSEAARAVVQEIQSHAKPLPSTVYFVAPEEKLMRIFEDAIQHARHAL